MKKRWILVAVVLLIVLVGTVFVIRAAKPGGNRAYIDRLYDAIHDAQWKNTQSRQARAEKLQIPLDKLAGFSDEELVYALVEYPFNVDLLVFNTYRQGYEHLAQEINILKEMDRRDHMGGAWLKQYGILSDSSEEDFLLGYAEIYLAQPEIRSTIAKDDIAKLEEAVDANADKPYLKTYQVARDEILEKPSAS